MGELRERERKGCVEGGGVMEGKSVHKRGSARKSERERERAREGVSKSAGECCVWEVG